jgi:ribosomal 50S subunit-recycling heat shock protein
MRIDLCLSLLCLFKTRSQAGRACAEGRVFLNGQPARASRNVEPGDLIRFQDRLGRIEEEVEVLALPAASTSKKAARDLVRVISRRVMDDPWDGPATV